MTDIPGELFQFSEFFPPPTNIALHNKAAINPHQIRGKWLAQQIIANRDAQCVHAALDQRQINHCWIHGNIAMIAQK